MFPKLKLKRAVAKEPSPPPFPLSLISSRRPTRTKPTWSTELHQWFFAGIVACSAGFVSVILSPIFTRYLIRFIEWQLDESQNNNVFTILWSNVTRVTRVFRGKRAWDDLPPELCREIGKRLVSRLDILCFRCVCKRWRSALPTPTRFPLLVPPPPSCDPEFRNIPYFITEVSLYRFKRSVTYVAFEEVGRGKFRTHYVYPRSATKSITEAQKHPHSHIFFLSKGYLVRMASFQVNKFAKKVVLISSNADGVYPGFVGASGLSAVAHLSWGEMKGRLALLRLGRSHLDWDTNFSTQVFEAIGPYKGRLCTLDKLGRVFLMDYNSLQMTQVAPPLSVVCGPEEKRLFEADGDLYVAHYKKNGLIEGYKLSLQYNRWLKPKGGIADKLSALVPYHL